MKLNVTLTNIQVLARLVSHYEFGGCPEARLASQFDGLLNQLQSVMVEWRPLLAGLRHRPSGLMRGCDEALNIAVRLYKSKQYKEGLIQLKLARNQLTLLQELLEAYGEYGYAVDAYQKLKALLDSENLCQLLTIKTMSRLLEESDKLLAAGRSRQARFIARLCRNKIVTLNETIDKESEKIPGLSLKIKRQTEFFMQTEAFAPSPISDIRLLHALERLPVLLVERHILLVTRLIEDIEYELAPRRTVLASIQRFKLCENSDIAAQKVMTELKRIIYQESWEKAATYLLRQTLNVIGSDVNTIKLAVGHSSQKMEASHTNNSQFKPEVDLDLN